MSNIHIAGQERLVHQSVQWTRGTRRGFLAFFPGLARQGRLAWGFSYFRRESCPAHKPRIQTVGCSRKGVDHGGNALDNTWAILRGHF